MGLSFSRFMGVCLLATLGGMTQAVAETNVETDVETDIETTGEQLTGDEIRELVWGNRVQGSMADGQAYSEIYLPNGEILGNGYSGQATIVDNTMCFDYGSDEVSCYGVRHNSDGRIEWLEDGDVAGYGDISEAP